MSAQRVIVAGASWAEQGSALVGAIAEAMPAYEVTAAGVRGATIGRWYRDVMQRDDLRGALVLVVEMGGNGIPATQLVRDAQRGLESKGARVAWALPPVWPVAGTIGTRRAAAKRSILAARVPTVATVAIGAADVGRDGVHLTRGGYRSIGLAIGRNAQQASIAIPLVAAVVFLPLILSVLA
jgi:hypothetical protein